MSIKLQRAATQFHLMGAANSNTTFEIADAVLYVRKVKINPSVILAHHKALSVASAIDNIFLGLLPKRCIIGFVRTAAFSGDITLNPFNFTSFNYTQVGVNLDSICITTKPFICDFPNNQYMRAYHSLFEGCNINHSDIGNSISRSDYPNGYALLAVDLTPDLSSSAAHISLPRTGSLRIDVHFAAALEHSITAVIFAEFDSLITVDKNRSVVTDYSS